MTATDGRLVEILKELRAEGLSYGRITSELGIRYGLAVSQPTVKSWCDELEPLNHTA